MKTLEFLNPTFHSGRNVSVRRGIKWNLEREAIIDTRPVNITTKVVPFNRILDTDLAMEHDPNCRTYEGLLKCMKETYPGFDQYEIVTVVAFDAYWM